MSYIRSIRPPRFGAVLALSLALAGCGGGDSGGSAVLALRGSTPADGATGVSTGVLPQMQFSHSLDAGTVTTSQVQLSHAGGQEPLALDATGASLTATPARRLRALTAYTLRVRRGVEGAGGERLAADVTVGFTTGDATWTPQATLVQDRGSPSVPRQNVLVERSGAATVVWTQSNGADDTLWAQRIAPTGAAEPARRIDTAGGRVTDVRLAEGRDGEVFVAWTHLDGIRYNVWVTRFAPGTGWDTAHALEAATQSAYEVRVGADAAGNAVAVWYQYDGVGHDVWAASRAPGGAWTAAQRIESFAGSATAPELAMSAAGVAFAAWTHFDGTRNGVWAARFTPAGGWQAAQLVDAANVNDRIDPRIAVSARGEAVIIWSENEGTRRTVVASRYAGTTGWGASQVIGSNTAGDAEGLALAMDDAGNAMAAWHQQDAGDSNVWVNRFDVAGGWGAPRRMDPDGTWGEYAQVALDARGNGLLVWQEEVGGNCCALVGARYRRDTGWGTRTVVTPKVVDPHLAMNAAGVGMAVWRRTDTATPGAVLGRRFD